MLREIDEFEFVNIGYYASIISNTANYDMRKSTSINIEKIDLKNCINLFQISENEVKLFYDSEIILDPYRFIFFN